MLLFGLLGPFPGTASAPPVVPVFVRHITVMVPGSEPVMNNEAYGVSQTRSLRISVRPNT